MLPHVCIFVCLLVCAYFAVVCLCVVVVVVVVVVVCFCFVVVVLPLFCFVVIRFCACVRTCVRACERACVWVCGCVLDYFCLLLLFYFITFIFYLGVGGGEKYLYKLYKNYRRFLSESDKPTVSVDVKQHSTNA